MDFNFSQIDLKQEASSKERIYFLVIILLIIVSFARWLYIPKMAQTKKVQAEIASSKMQIDTLKKFAQLKLPVATTQATEQKVKTGSKFEKAIEESMRSEQQVVADIVKLITQSNILNGVSLAGMNFGAEVNKGTYGYVPVSIELQGRYTGILSYLERVEKLGKLITADNVEISAKENPSKVTAKIMGSIYVINPKPIPPQGAGQGEAGQVKKK